MPPYTYPTTFEEIEAKEWASNTLNTILSDISPLSFEPDYYFCNQSPFKKNVTIHGGRQKKADNPLRRSLSYLEGSLFSSHSAIEKEQKNARRSQSTILPAAPAGKVLLESSFSSDFRDELDTILMPTPNNLLDHRHKNKKPNKIQQKAIQVWKDTYIKYTIDPPPHVLVQSKPHTKRSIQLSKFIMTELLTTEETYLDHLLTVKNFYMDPLLDAAVTTKFIHEKDVDTIFAYIPELIQLSSTLVKQLKDATTTCLSTELPSDASIGKALCDLDVYFDIYISYTVNFTKSRKILSKASSSIVYRQIVQETMRAKETNRMLLSDYMIAPIQRITRYCLLLKDLLRYSHPSNSDHVYLERAFKSLSALASAMNTIQ